MRYEHILTYDQDEHEKSFLYDNKGERVCLDNVCNLINNEVNRILHGIVLDDISKVDSALLGYFDNKTGKQEEIGTNVIKSVSEAVVLATAACY
jgi:enolase